MKYKAFSRSTFDYSTRQLLPCWRGKGTVNTRTYFAEKSYIYYLYKVWKMFIISKIKDIFKKPQTRRFLFSIELLTKFVTSSPSEIWLYRHFYGFSGIFSHFGFNIQKGFQKYIISIFVWKKNLMFAFFKIVNLCKFLTYWFENLKQRGIPVHDCFHCKNKIFIDHGPMQITQWCKQQVPRVVIDKKLNLTLEDLYRRN